MRKLKLYIAASLDGKIARRDGGLDWLPDPRPKTTATRPSTIRSTPR
jgi:riboflavin biosynthesis pyrimidine reductase